MYAEAILDAGGGGRVVPGLADLLDSTNPDKIGTQRQKRPVPTIRNWRVLKNHLIGRYPVPKGKSRRFPVALDWRSLGQDCCCGE